MPFYGPDLLLCAPPLPARRGKFPLVVALLGGRSPYSLRTCSAVFVVFKESRMTYGLRRNHILPARPAPRCCVLFQTKSRRAYIACTVEVEISCWEWNMMASGTDNLCTRDGSNHWDITSDARLPRLPTLGLLSTCTVAVPM